MCIYKIRLASVSLVGFVIISVGAKIIPAEFIRHIERKEMSEKKEARKQQPTYKTEWKNNLHIHNPKPKKTNDINKNTDSSWLRIKKTKQIVILKQSTCFDAILLICA